MSAVHAIVGGRFVCSAGPSASCRTYPACDCEYWSREVHGQKYGDFIGRANSGHPLYASETIAPQPGHENVQQDECWLQGWMEAGDLWECYEVEEVAYSNDEFPDGPIDYTWHGDYLTWQYDGPMRPAFKDEEVDA